MIIKLTKKNNGEEIIQTLIKKYNSKEELEKQYKLTNDPLLFIDLEDWKFFESHPNETQIIGKTLISKDISLNKLDFKILSLLKKEDNTLNSLSEKLDEDISIIKPHIKKLEDEGIIDKNENQMTIPQFKYDEITIEIE